MGRERGNARTLRREPGKQFVAEQACACACAVAEQSRERHCGTQESETMSASTVAARRALQQQQARYLYRRALKSVLNWAVHREIFYVEVRKHPHAPFGGSEKETGIYGTGVL